MSEYTIGKGRPPIETRFKKGNREFLKRKKKSAHIDEREIFLRVLTQPIEYREGTAVKRGPRIAVHIKQLLAAAANGDVSAAAMLIDMHEKFKDVRTFEPTIIQMLPGDEKL